MGSGGPIAIKSGHAPYSSGIPTCTPCKAVMQTLMDCKLLGVVNITCISLASRDVNKNGSALVHLNLCL